MTNEERKWCMKEYTNKDIDILKILTFLDIKSSISGGDHIDICFYWVKISGYLKHVRHLKV